MFLLQKACASRRPSCLAEVLPVNSRFDLTLPQFSDMSLPFEAGLKIKLEAKILALSFTLLGCIRSLASRMVSKPEKDKLWR